MKKIGQIIIPLILLLLVSQMPVKALAEEQYVEVEMSANSTLEISTKIKVKTDATKDKTFSMFKRNREDSWLELYKDSETIEGPVSLYSKEGVKFYVPKSKLSEISITNTPLYEDFVVKPGEYYEMDFSDIKGWSGIVMADKNSVVQVDRIFYHYNGDIWFYSMTAGTDYAPYSLVPQGGKIRFGNLEKENRSIAIPTIYMNRVKKLEGTIWNKFYLNPGENIKTLDEGFTENNSANNRIVTPVRKGFDSPEIDSIGYNADSVLWEVGGRKELARGYSTIIHNPGKTKVELYQPKEYTNDVFKAPSEEIVHKELLNYGDTFKYISDLKAKKNLSINSLDRESIKYDEKRYDENGQVFDISKWEHTMIQKKFIGGEEYRNTSSKPIEIIIPLSEKNKVSKNNNELIKTITINPGERYKIINTNNNEDQKIAYYFTGLETDIDINYTIYSDKYEVISQSPTYGLSGRINKGERMIFTNINNHSIDLNITSEDAKKLIRVEDIDSSGVVNIKDLSSLATFYNQKLNNAEMLFKYDQNSDEIIDIYDIVRISKLL